MARCPTCQRRLRSGTACPVHGGEPAPADPVELQPRPVDTLLDIPLGEPLGAGGFATVYRLGSDRVAKVALVSHDLARARIAREAEALGAIGPPAVPALHGSGVLSDGRAWLVMDRVAGTTFSELTTAGPMPVAEATRLAIGMLDALAKVHAAGIVHRDLKPDNLFRTSDGKVVVIDLGLARKIPTDPDDPTRANVQVGSLEYMPPEQLVDAASVDERSDLYAFGCVLFELLAGRPPFTGDAAALERAHAALRPPRLDSLVEVPPTVAQIVQDCLAKDPARRPRMASRVRAQLGATHEDTGFRTGTQPVSIMRESKQPVVILYAELPRVDRTLLGMFAARRLVIVSQKGRRVIAGALGGEHGDPAGLALAAAADLAAAGARVALHLDALRVGAGPSLQGEPVEKPETWLPTGPWTGVVITRALASVIQAPTREAEGHPGFRALGGEVQRSELFGREALLTDLAGDAAVALTGRGEPVASRTSRNFGVGGPGFALLVGDAGVGKTVFADALASRLRELGVAVHTGSVPLPGTGKPAASALGMLAPAAGVRAIGDALRAAARERPTAVILDDLHLADHELDDAIEYATLGGEPLPLWIL
ncbi:MAG: serine/threonine-protein kinase, partial [Kofleriaceae bacterium]